MSALLSQLSLKCSRQEKRRGRKYRTGIFSNRSCEIPAQTTSDEALAHSFEELAIQNPIKYLKADDGVILEAFVDGSRQSPWAEHRLARKRDFRTE